MDSLIIVSQTRQTEMTVNLCILTL